MSEPSKTNNEERKVSLLIGQILEDGAGIVEDRFEDDKTPTDKYFSVAHKLPCDHFWYQILVSACGYKLYDLIKVTIHEGWVQF